MAKRLKPTKIRLTNKTNLNTFKKELADAIVEHMAKVTDMKNIAVRKIIFKSRDTATHRYKIREDIELKQGMIKTGTRPTGTILIKDFDVVLDSMVTQQVYVFKTARDDRVCEGCESLDYNVTGKLWTLDEIKQLQGFKLKKKAKNGRKVTYTYESKHKVTHHMVNPPFDTMECDMHYNCRCQFIPLSIYNSGTFVPMGRP